MITASFLLEWAVRSAVLTGLATLLPRLARVKNPSIRLTACIAAVCASLAMPLFNAVVPKWPVRLIPTVESKPAAPISMPEAGVTARFNQQGSEPGAPVDWGAAVVAVYTLIAGGLVLRLATGIVGAQKLRRGSRATGLEVGGVEVRESGQVASPFTIGILRPAIVLPRDWREWSREKLEAVLTHERSHASRRDPAVQFLSAMHRALLWYSPLSWMLHGRIVRLAEEASDEAAVAATRDRASYAEIVLDFMQRGVGVNWHGVAMARYGCPEDRIDRILDSPMRFPRLTGKAAAAVLALALPLSYVTAAVGLPAPGLAIGPVSPLTQAATATVVAQQTPAAEPRTIRPYLIFLGDTESASWDSRESVDRDAVRARFGRRFAWFRQGGAERVITDEAVLGEIERAMEPQKKVNAAQNRVNQLQSVVNGLQQKVNSQQGGANAEQDNVNARQSEVNAAQAQVNKRQDILNRIQSASTREKKEVAVKELEKLLAELRAAPDGATQEDVNRLQSKVTEAQARTNELQGKMNQEQARVNEEQQKVNHEQHLVNEQQKQVSAEFSRRIQQIFASAIARGLAPPVN